MAHREFRFLLLNEAIWGKHWEEDLGLLGLAVPSNGSNCLVLIPDKHLGNCLLSTKDSYSLIVQLIHRTLHKSVWHLSKTWLLTKVHDSMLNWILVPVSGRDICWKIASNCRRNSSPSPACRMDTMETPATKAADATKPWTVPWDICALAIL